MDAISLQALENLNQPVVVQQAVASSDHKNAYRLEALREAAFGVGARGGLVSQNRVIEKALQKVKRNLDTVYDFAPLMIKARVVPPVLTETRDIYTQGGAVTLRLAGRSYKVEEQAHFSSRPPQWRQYLLMDLGDVSMPSPELLPRTAAEQDLWRKNVAKGWKKGVAQANEILQLNLNRLNRDYVGMVRYHILALKRMVTIPVVAEQNMPLNSSGNTMNLDETLLRITALPEFNTDIRKWMPLAGEVGVMQGPVSANDAKASSQAASGAEGVN